MWLLKLHFSVSVLCLLTFLGFGKVFKDTIINNGYSNVRDNKQTKLTSWLLFFVPLLNIGSVVTLFVMIGMKKEDLDKWTEEHKKKDSGDENGA